jgi:outer membrane protein TolC
MRSITASYLGRLVVATACALGVARGAYAKELSVADALALAADKNPTLKAAGLDTQAAKLGVDSAEGARDPVLSASVQGGYAENASASGTIGAGESVTSKVALDYTTAIGTKLEVGTQADLGWHPGQGGAISPDPTFTGLAFVSARQPLLKGAGTDVNLAPIAQAENGATAAEKQEELQASSTALDVLEAYWELWYADRAIAVDEQALEVAQKQLADANARVNELGTASPVDVLQFSSNVASINDTLAQAKASRTNRAFELGRLLGMEQADALAITVNDELPEPGTLAPIDSLVARAIDRSPDLAAMRADLDSARIRLSTAADADQPRLDLFTTVSAGAEFSPDALGGSKYGIVGGRPTFSVVGGLELELPIGGGSASSEHARALVQLNAAEVRYDAKVDAIAADVTTKRVSAEAAYGEVDLSKTTADVSNQLARAEETRLTLGTSTSSDVVKAEQTAREANLRSLRAEVDAVKGQYELAHATGSLLDGIGSVMVGRKS